MPDYYDIIKKPMDLSTMMGKIDLHHYTTTSAFMDDIFLICSNALEYNPDKGPTGELIYLLKFKWLQIYLWIEYMVSKFILN